MSCAERPPLEKNDPTFGKELKLTEHGREQTKAYDINVACFLAGCGVVTRFEEYNWPRYLDAAVAFISQNGQARYGYMRTMENRMRIDL